MKTDRILVVEDSTSMRQVLLYALRKMASVHLVEAADGVDALRKLADETFDLVITDINMPIMSGLKLLRMIKGSPSLQGTPVIIVTAEDEERERMEGLRNGATACIPKPIRTPLLVEVVQEALGRN